MPSSKRLQNKVAVITGAANGIGRATAELYAEHGATVLLADMRPAEGLEAVAAIRCAGGEALFVSTDVGDAAQVERLVGEAVERFGRLDIMTANAGILGRGDRVGMAEMIPDNFREVIEVNLFGVVNAFRFAIPAMMRTGGGVLTATTSISAHVGVKGLSAYTASKAAIVGLLRSVTADYGPSIRANAVSPGAVETMIAKHTAELNGQPAGSVVPRHAPVISARDIANAHLFLVSEESRFMFGQTLVVDGGRSAVDR